METKQQQQTKEAPRQTGKRPAFCLRLNTFRALSCLSVIITHIVSFSGLVQTFPSWHFGGHQAVYFFFNLSGYLLSLSLIKEVKRRVYAHKKKTTSGDDERGLVATNSQSDQIELYQTTPAVVQPKPTFLQKVKSSLLACIVGKYLWNRMWKTFPMYWGAWLVLKTFAHEGTRVQTLRPSNTWAQILGLKIFPGHLWTMRIDMMFYFYVTPIYICVLYGAFKLQKAGFKKLAKMAFAAIIGCLIGIAYYGIHMVPGCLHPFKYEEIFLPNLPPFCFGMMAGLANFALEKRFNARQAANAQEPKEADETEGQDDSLVGKIKAFILRNKYSIIFTVVFLRIMSLNPGFYFFFYPDNIPAEAAPTWQIANWHSYWYGIFILINDTRGGFWKFMHPKEAKPTTLHPSPLHKVIYYFGLWSYAIYLTHPLSYDTLKRLFPNQQYTTEYWTGSIVLAFIIGVFVDFTFDKLLTEKLIMGKIFKNLNKVIMKKESPGGQEVESAKAASSS